MPPQNPVDKKAAASIREAQQRIQGHQPPLQEAEVEQNKRLEPSTGQAITFTSSAAGASSTGSGDSEPKDYWQMRLLMEGQQRRLNVADERSMQLTHSNNWARPTVDQQTVQHIEEIHQRRHEEDLRLQAEAQLALERARNTEPVRLNPDAPEFQPGRSSEGQGSSGTQGR